MSTASSLLQDVLRPHAFGVDKINSKLASASLDGDSPPSRQAILDDSDDELVGVMSIPGSPSRSGAPSRQSSRPSSPTRIGANKRKLPGPLHLSRTKETSSDPLRAFPTEVTQRIFALLDVKDLGRCARVCKKWERSQSLNYVWFQHVRRETFQDETLPPGKWTRRESKQNWRVTYMQSTSQREREIAENGYTRTPRSSRPASPFNNSLSFSNIMSTADTERTGRISSRHASGYVTPREAREESWRQEAEEKEQGPTKVEMRELYKELGGRKARTKGKFGNAVRDKGGWDAAGFDDGNQD